MIFSKNLLLSAKRKVTLTVVTNPASATVTLTVDGVQYSTNSLEVPINSVVNYSIYHSTYGTTTGSVVMNSDKTLNCNGTYDTTSTWVEWYAPHNLTSNGTMGGANFACYGAGYSNGYAYLAFNGSQDGSANWAKLQRHGSTGQAASGSPYLVFYIPQQSKIRALYFKTGSGNGASGAVGTLYGSNNNSSWTAITNFSQTTASTDWNFSTNTNNTYNYYKLEFSQSTYAQSGYYFWYIGELYITALIEQTSYSYYWETTIS